MWLWYRARIVKSLDQLSTHARANHLANSHVKPASLLPPSGVTMVPSRLQTRPRSTMRGSSSSNDELGPQAGNRLKTLRATPPGNAPRGRLTATRLAESLGYAHDRHAPEISPHSLCTQNHVDQQVIMY